MDTSILIVSSYRCGGWYLSKYLSAAHNLEIIHEPADLPAINSPSVVKVTALKATANKLIEYSKNFSKVILLDRRNKDDQTKSLLVLWEIKDGVDIGWEWKEEYKNVGKGYEHYYQFLNEHSDKLNELAQLLNIPVTYYEDLYNLDMDNELNFKPDLRKKYRRVVNKVII